MKNEVLGNLKGLGNTILGKFGMSLDNFKLNQNPDGTYNIAYQNQWLKILINHLLNT